MWLSGVKVDVYVLSSRSFLLSYGEKIEWLVGFFIFFVSPSPTLSLNKGADGVDVLVYVLSVY